MLIITNETDEMIQLLSKKFLVQVCSNEAVKIIKLCLHFDSVSLHFNSGFVNKIPSKDSALLWIPSEFESCRCILGSANSMHSCKRLQSLSSNESLSG